MGTAIRIAISGRSASGFRAMRPRCGFAAAAERVRDDTGPLAAPFADARPRPSLRASSSVIRVTDFSLDLDDESRVEIPVLERVVGVLRRVAARVGDYASSDRSAERRVGRGCVRRGRSGGWGTDERNTRYTRRERCKHTKAKE